ncbi:MAG: nicotinate-nucleotide adenylyltransferase [Gemmatimonadaceae bacterium]|nr:nicotinate-nucleotide adenylyltransferase [Gemmatimonadaceae bacterium]MCW5825473.1 nicotinate-nucleotide adenylyltransferase [Gemmatimonadaceae bacterium]
MATRIGILGGTFDPPHIGHLLLALDAVEALGLDQLVFVPAARQPLKQGVPMTAAEHRLAMVRLLAAADSRFHVDDSEVTRGGLSFTIDTVRGLRTAHPDAELFLLMGADTAATLPQWRETEALALLVQVAVAGRGDGPMPKPAGFRVQPLPSRRVDISATEIRVRVGAGRSIRGFVPDAVADYIAAHGLYRTTTE